MENRYTVHIAIYSTSESDKCFGKTVEQNDGDQKFQVKRFTVLDKVVRIEAIETRQMSQDLKEVTKSARNPFGERIFQARAKVLWWEESRCTCLKKLIFLAVLIIGKSEMNQVCFLLPRSL